MEQKITTKKILLLFLMLILFTSVLKLLGLWAFIVVLILGFVYWSKSILTIKKKIKFKQIKSLIPYYFVLFFLSGLDMLSTKFFVLNEGVDNEANLIFVFLYNIIGNYAFLIMPVFGIFTILFISIFFLKKYNLKDTQHFLKTFCCIYLLIPIFNVLF